MAPPEAKTARAGAKASKRGPSSLDEAKEDKLAEDSRRRPTSLRTLQELTRDYEKQWQQQREQRAARESAAVAPGASQGGGSRTGTVKKVFRSKGFGFVAADDGSGDVFLHVSDLASGGGLEDMAVGRRVLYDRQPGPRGAQARARHAELLDEGLPRRRSEKYQPASTPAKAGPGSPAPRRARGARRTYTRQDLLEAFDAIRRAWPDGEPVGLGISTVRLPRVEAEDSEPTLDDEALLSAMEERLSRESGADARNGETFGDDLTGWSFQEALEANEVLAQLPGLCASGLRPEAPCFEPAAATGEACDWDERWAAECWAAQCLAWGEDPPNDSTMEGVWYPEGEDSIAKEAGLLPQAEWCPDLSVSTDAGRSRENSEEADGGSASEGDGPSAYWADEESLGRGGPP